MYCGSCGKEVPESFRYCSECGAPTTVAERVYCQRPKRALQRPQSERKLAGVCAGIANYLDVDVTLIRIIFLCLLFWPPPVGGILYLVCWAVMPNERLLLPPAATTTTQSVA